MDVDVRHRLSCRWAVLDAEGQRVASEVLLDFLPHLLCQLPQIRHLLPSQIAEAMRHPLRTDQHVSCPTRQTTPPLSRRDTWHDRSEIDEGVRELRRRKDFRPLDSVGAERKLPTDGEPMEPRSTPRGPTLSFMQ